ncbi:4Fe-4S dicluster domain-containing protein [uncultured Ferrimonas sp.]|uniref:4Fe-4S dicluster domain-containing protein n=1 Tax=uncultured Ferrimonas sp. TaxID=432640 RepID=UPI0026364824|nr:4Fe-4S dicluster domain-containing protein [uncultured Ferrimonas sp.]
MFNRRTAIKALVVGATSVSFASAASTLGTLRDKGGKHLAMLIDLRRCNGCKACVVACGNENGNLPDEHRTEVYQSSAEINGKQYAFNLPLMCNNCDKPTCTEVCPTGATFKRPEDGIVVVDSTECIACELCIEACPYSAVRFVHSETGTVDKCNFCIQRTSRGLLPACVATCTGGARMFGDINDPNSEIAKALNQHNPLVLQANKKTDPNVFYIGLSQAQSNTAFSLKFPQAWQR